jgi:MoaA/NifB/PqqE/SkfB family radical SAM enzyme
MARRRPYPFSMTFILTHRCNFQCDYCDIPAAARGEMSTADFCRAIDELRSAGMARASFSGGEALLRPDALDIIAHARAAGSFTSLNSNAWIALQHIDRLAEILDMLVLSLDGPAALHDRVRNRRGSYDRVLRTVDAARARGLTTATITVLCGANLDAVEDILELARHHGFVPYFQPAYTDCFDHKRGLDPALGPRIFADLARRLAAAKDRGYTVGASDSFLGRLARGPAFGACETCTAGRYFATVMPDGTMVPCHLTSGDHDYPNGLERGFAETFFAMPRPRPGPGCAISPYQECDLIFGLDRAALVTAGKRMAASVVG